jgi:hypothetical protein
MAGSFGCLSVAPRGKSIGRFVYSVGVTSVRMNDPYGRPGLLLQFPKPKFQGLLLGVILRQCQQQPGCEPLSQSHLSHSAIIRSRSVALPTQFFGVFPRIFLTTHRDILESFCLRLSEVGVHVPALPAGNHGETEPSIPSLAFVIAEWLSQPCLILLCSIFYIIGCSSPEQLNRPGNATSSFAQDKLTEHALA